MDRHQGPYLHNTYFGKAAYETFHTAAYLDELVRTRRFPKIIQPTFLLLYLSILATGCKTAEFLELGSSLYSAFEKLQNCKAFLGSHEEPDIQHIAVELSDRLRWIAQAVHEGAPIAHFARHQDVHEPTAPRFAFSLGVANYAFKSTPELAHWLMRSNAAVIRERFTCEQEFSHDLIGKRFTCFDVNELQTILSQNGFKVCVLSCAEAPAFVEASSQLPSSSSIFFNAYLFVHRLSPLELSTLCDLIKTSGAADIPPSYDADPIVRLSIEQLSCAPEIGSVLSGIQWQRQYVRREVRRGRRRFDFSKTSLPARVKDHLVDLDMAYGSNLTQRNAGFIDRVRPVFSQLAGRTKIIVRALSGEPNAIAIIKRRLRLR